MIHGFFSSWLMSSTFSRSQERKYNNEDYIFLFFVLLELNLFLQFKEERNHQFSSLGIPQSQNPRGNIRPAPIRKYIFVGDKDHGTFLSLSTCSTWNSADWFKQNNFKIFRKKKTYIQSKISLSASIHFNALWQQFITSLQKEFFIQRSDTFFENFQFPTD